MLVKDVMMCKPEFVCPTDSVKDVACQMRKHSCGCMLVGENDRLVGVVTVHDVVMRCVAEGKDCVKMMVKDVMTPKVLYCFEGDSVEKVVKMMQKEHVNCFAVLNSEKRYTGLVSLSNIASKCNDVKLCKEVVDVVCHS